MIIRSRRPDTDFTILENRILRDSRLSWRARGILAYLLSMPDGWKTSSHRLSQAGREGRDAVRSALKELETVGYVQIRRQQDTVGRWSTAYVVYDIPCGQHLWTTGTPEPDNPTPESQAVKEELTTKNLLEKGTAQPEPLRICGQCDGTGWQTDGLSLSRCQNCDGEGM